MIEDKIKLFIVDRDAIYRLGLRTAIASYPDFAIVGEGNFGNDTWRELTQGLTLNVLVVGLDSDANTSSREFCQQISQLYPQLPQFVLTTNFSAKKLAQVRSWGIKGYCDRHSSINAIVEGLHAVAYGNTYWQQGNVPRPRLWQQALSKLSRSGRQELAREIELIDTQLTNPNLSDWEKVFLVGRKRELLTARWLSNRLVAQEAIEADSPQSTAGELVPVPATELVALPVFEDSANKKVFERVVTDIQIGLVNRTQVFLEIDILQPKISRGLCQIILKRLSDTIQQVPIAITIDRNYSEYLADLWSWTTNYFFRLHYGELTAEEQERLEQIISFEFRVVERNIFDYIYGVPELVEYLLGKPGVSIDNIFYQSDDPEAIARIEFLLHNLIINLANSVMLVILNNFYDLEIFKSQLYKPEYKSDRQLARFRNQLSWKYRQEKYLEQPQNIFESRYRLFVINNGIRTSFIYAPRKAELEQLSGIPWLTTIVIEIRDAIAPLARKFIAFAGSGVVFVLTQVIGKGLGLIGKGIIQGIGSTIKDINPKK